MLLVQRNFEPANYSRRSHSLPIYDCFNATVYCQIARFEVKEIELFLIVLQV